MPSKSLKFIDKLKELLEEGIKIRISIAPYRERSLVSENNLLSNHKKWEIQVEEFFEKQDKKQLLPKYFLKNQDLSIPPSRNTNGVPIIDMGSNVFIKPERLEKLQNFRKDIDLALKEQLEILEKIIEKLTKKGKILNGKSNDNKEEINLKSYGIKINGRDISRRNEKSKKVFDPTEESLIYFLYYRLLKNREECFKIEILAKELKTTVGHLKNRITNIHKILGESVSKNTPPKIAFIKNEPKRGYHLNPKLFT